MTATGRELTVPTGPWRPVADIRMASFSIQIALGGHLIRGARLPKARRRGARGSQEGQTNKQGV